MRPSKNVIGDLRDEYLELMKKVAAARFAVMTLPLDDEETRYLTEQIAHMEDYGVILLNRAKYKAKPKEGTNE